MIQQAQLQEMMFLLISPDIPIRLELCLLYNLSRSSRDYHITPSTSSWSRATESLVEASGCVPGTYPNIFEAHRPLGTFRVSGRVLQCGGRERVALPTAEQGRTIVPQRFSETNNSV